MTHRDEKATEQIARDPRGYAAELRSLRAENERLREALHRCRADYHAKVIALQQEVRGVRQALERETSELYGRLNAYESEVRRTHAVVAAAKRWRVLASRHTRADLERAVDALAAPKGATDA